MALIVTDEVTQEAKSILTASNAFEVLGITPAEFSRDVVKRKHEEKVQRLKPFFRNKSAALARNRVDDAKMRLLDDRLREKELQVISTKLQQEAAEREELRELEDWTRHLEMKASVIMQRNELRLASSTPLPTNSNNCTWETNNTSDSATPLKTTEGATIGVKRSRD